MKIEIEVIKFTVNDVLTASSDWTGGTGEEE